MRDKIDPKNRLNDLDSRRWLPFQKSWFPYDPHRTLADFVEFFTKKRYADGHRGTLYLWPDHLLEAIPATLQASRLIATGPAAKLSQQLDYAIFDLHHLASPDTTAEQVAEALTAIHQIAGQVREFGYVTVMARNRRLATTTQPLAWRLAKLIGEFLVQKDERVGCLEVAPRPEAKAPDHAWLPDDRILYFLNFRKEKSVYGTSWRAPDLMPLLQNQQMKAPAGDFRPGDFRTSWFIWKPPPRSRDVLLHPAKFPENLVQQFVRTFTRPAEWVFDPMAGTGSSLLASTDCGRRACGIELNPEFAEIARARFPSDGVNLVVGDASDEASYATLPPALDYCMTSPPYWDMLRAYGGETQARRKAKGLPRWYSDDERDVGNIADYEQFLDSLVAVYRETSRRLRSGRYMTIIVKNVKKKGRIYPLAWDLTERLQPLLTFAGEQLWCQDDQRLAPFGYRYAWVSNTFHHYCLTFRKP